MKQPLVRRRAAYQLLLPFSAYEEAINAALLATAAPGTDA